MNLKSRVTLWLALATCGGSASAADLSLSVEIPQLPVAEYHRPYVAVWIEGADQVIAANLAVWYQLRGDHTKWLPDLRQWWRRGGRDVKVPVDGLTGATRPVGQHILKFDAAKAPLTSLKPGRYTLVVEAVREGYVFPDTNAHGEGENPQWVYTVVFDGSEIWGEDADPTLTVSIDAWESYLEPA